MRSRKRNTCSTEAWDYLINTLEKRRPVLKLRIADLREVVECHQRHCASRNAPVALPAVRSVGRKFCRVSRQELFDFIQVHGKVCGQ